MMVLLRSMLCLSLVYVTILRGALPWTSQADERQSGVSLTDTRDRAASGLMALCRHRPADCLAALAAVGPAGIPAAKALASQTGTTKGTERGPEPRRQRPAFRLTKTP